MKNPIFPCLWFDGKAKEAALFYCSIFKNSKILSDSPSAVNFELNGRKFMALNGGPHYSFNPAISFVIECSTQQEIDHYWEELSRKGEEGRCGWVTDRYGISWQIIPSILPQLMADPGRAENVQKAFLTMDKLIIKDLLKA